MTNPKPPLPHRHSDHLSSGEACRHVFLWILLALASLLMVGFTAIVGDTTQRGESRRNHQTASGLPNPSEAWPILGVEVIRWLSPKSDKQVER